MIVDKIFPTAVGYVNNLISEEENKNIIDSCYEIKIKKDLYEKNMWLSKDKSPHNNYLDGSLHTNKKFKILSDAVELKVNEFSKIFNDTGKYCCLNSWFNIYNDANYQEIHLHQLPCIYSAVYFASAPEGSGQIVFESPYQSWYYEDLIEDQNEMTFSKFMYKPITNSLLIFRSSLKHFVLHGNNSDDRISIAFNFILDPLTYINRYGNYEVRVEE